MTIVLIVLLSLAVGVLVGLLGIGGGRATSISTRVCC
jgi:hypothetical protein